jgi:tRNA threonylcarbamoyladenosine biosynthesis protein TsaE
MIERVVLGLPDAAKTAFAGRSLADSLYGSPPLYLTGAVGAGKTTFLQGFGEALGLPGDVLSPTFALAHPHLGRDGSVRVTHIDLYRLDEEQARAFMDRLSWEGMLWTEWADRLPRERWQERHIHAHLSDDGTGRRLELAFADAELPSSGQIEAWRAEVGTPPNVVEHCETVGRIARAVAEHLVARGRVVRPALCEAGGRLHDMLRFVDFLPGKGPAVDSALEARWDEWRARFEGQRHEPAAALFLRDRGFAELSEAVRTHGSLPAEERLTIEQKIVFYADKRAIGGRVVSSAERFEDFRERYAGSGQTEAWMLQTEALERELFPDGPPDLAALRATATGA